MPDNSSAEATGWTIHGDPTLLLGHEVLSHHPDPRGERPVLRDDERRQLLLIEQNLLAEAPELAEQFARLAPRSRSGRGYRTMVWLAASVSLLGVVLGEVRLVLGALVLLAVSAVLLPAPVTAPDQPDRPCG